MTGATHHVCFVGEDQGLDIEKLYDIEQDAFGNFWISGGSNLVRYDGVCFSYYNTMGSFPLQPKASIMDSHGDLWFVSIGKKGMVVKYDGNDFFGFNIPEQGPVKHEPACFQDSRGAYWFAVDKKGIYRLTTDSEDDKTDNVILYSEDNGLISNNIKCIFEDQWGNIWFGSDSAGLCRYEPPSEEFPYGSFGHFTVNEGLSHNNITCLACDREGRLWIGTGGGGVSIYDGSGFSHLTTDGGLCSNFINDILEDSYGNIWVASQGGGVNMLEFCFNDPNNCNLIHFTYEDNLTSNYILKISEDRDGNILFGTFGGTLHFYKPGFFIHTTEKQGYEYLWMKSPVEDREGNLWFGSETGMGVCRFDGNYFYYYSAEQGMSNHPVTTLHCDGNGDIWAGTSGDGLFRFTKKQLLHYPEGSGMPEHVTALAEDKHGNLWIGSREGAIYMFDRQSLYVLETNPMITRNDITDIFKDRDDNLWFGSAKGLALKYDSRDLYLVSDEKSAPYDCTVFFIQDNTGRIWYRNDDYRGMIAIDPGRGEQPGSAMAFSEVRHRKNEISGISTSNVLQSRHVKFVVHDNDDRIWLGTKGIDIIRVHDGSRGKRTTTMNLGRADGLKGDTPVLNSALIDSRNRLWYGFHRALCMLDLNRFSWPENTPGVHLNAIDIDQKAVDYKKRLLTKTRPGDKSDPYAAAIKYTAVEPWYNVPIGLSLPHFLNDVTFHYSAIDWRAPHKLRYAYMLEGLDSDWRSSTTETKAVYTNLDPGRYRFHLKAAGASGIWSEPVAYLFRVRAPWWSTGWAWAAYVSMLAGAFILWRRNDLRKQALSQELKLEKAKAEKLKEVDKMKTDFFANISHEFRTPLTLILGPLYNLIKNSENKESRDQLNVMQRNTRRLQRLIDQLLNIAMLEAGKMKLQVREENVVKLVRMYVQSFESYARQKKIDLVFQSEAGNIPVYVDRDKIEKILNNLLSNAFKFTPENGRIIVHIGMDKTEQISQSGAGSYKNSNNAERSYVSIRISDTGWGIPPDKLEHIFDRFYQAHENNSSHIPGSGIGLALTRELVELHHGKISARSAPGRGTTFSILLPLGRSHLKPEEIAVQKTRQSAIAKNEFETDQPAEDLIIPANKKRGQDETAPGRSDKHTGNEQIPQVLIVEDNADLRQYIRGFLEETYLVDEEDNGESGLKKAIETIPDLIISDIMMPVMNGNELCRRIKTDERTSHIPVILLTARASLESKIEGLGTGADDFITKPFEPEELKARAGNLIQQREKLREFYKKEISHGLLSKLGAEDDNHRPEVISVNRRFLEKAVEIVKRRLPDPEFNVEELAREIALSRAQLHRKLKALLGQNPSEFIRTIRLNQAAQLLVMKKGNVSEIAYDVGFNNPTYFSSSFRNQFGVSPTEFARRHKIKGQ